MKITNLEEAIRLKDVIDKCVSGAEALRLMARNVLNEHDAIKLSAFRRLTTAENEAIELGTALFYNTHLLSKALLAEAEHLDAQAIKYREAVEALD